MNIKKLLYESFDRNLTKDESKRLNSALNKSAGLRKEKESISNLRGVLKKQGAGDFSPGFEYELMIKINNSNRSENYQDIFFSSLRSIFRPLAYATIVFIILTLSYNFGRTGNISLKSAFGIKQQTTSFADDFKNLYSFYN